MRIIYEILYGSDAYGTTTQDSDNDVRGILLPTVDECISMKPLEDIHKKDETIDAVYFPLPKFIKLAVSSNPAVFEWLFVDNQCIYKMEEPAKILRNSRLLFLSKEIFYRFKGFGYSEFSNLTKLTGDTGDKRRKQILEYGYSPKNAMNCIRLLEQGIELLNTANLTMPRPNALDLIQIKKGALRYEQIAKRFDELLNQLEDAKEKSKLPDKPRFEDADRLLIQLIKDFN